MVKVCFCDACLKLMTLVFPFLEIIVCRPHWFANCKARWIKLESGRNKRHHCSRIWPNNFQFIRFLMKIVNEIYSSLVGCRHGDQWISFFFSIFIPAFHLIPRIYLAFNRFLVLIWRLKDEIPSSWWNSVENLSKERDIISVILSHSFEISAILNLWHVTLKKGFPRKVESLNFHDSAIYIRSLALIHTSSGI